jgi:hypothetical protein
MPFASFRVIMGTPSSFARRCLIVERDLSTTISASVLSVTVFLKCTGTPSFLSFAIIASDTRKPDVTYSAVRSRVDGLRVDRLRVDRLRVVRRRVDGLRVVRRRVDGLCVVRRRVVRRRVVVRRRAEDAYRMSSVPSAL